MYGVARSLAGLAAVAAVAHGLPSGNGSAIPLDVNDAASIKQASSTVLYNLMKTYYDGNVTEADLGLLPNPYFWWQAGALWGGLVDYWAYTGDAGYVQVVGEALVSQIASTVDFVMPNQHSGMGNDDQGFWALAAMSALEESFPVPDGSPDDLWYQLTFNVFNDYVTRWEAEDTCNGGLRWQVWPDNTGYDYKNTIANGCFMQLAARMARWSGNSTYSDWAGKVFDWLLDEKYIDNSTWSIADGAHVEHNCTDVNQAHYSYNSAMALYTTAVMWDVTQDEVWSTRMHGILNQTQQHYYSPFDNATNIMYEAQCELDNSCNTDQLSFKAYMARWMGKSVRIVPELQSQIQPLLTTSAQAAAKACSGGNNHTCGTHWYVGGYDGKYGMGQYLSALETFQSLLVFTGDMPEPGKQGGGPKKM